MNESIVIGLLQNIAVLLAFAMLYGSFWLHNDQPRSFSSKIYTGIVLGAIGIVLMHTPWTMAPGVVFDTRTIMLAVSALFFGAVPTVTAMIVTASMRFYMGGEGVWMGMATIVFAGTIGLLWARFRRNREQKNLLIEFLTLGLVVHIVMLGCTALLPPEKFIPTFKTLILPVFFIYTPGTILMGMMMTAQKRNAETRKEKERLYENEHRLGMELMNKQQKLQQLVKKYKKLNRAYQKQNLELKIAKERAEEGNRLKSSFLANLSHEIRTPMNAIMGFTDMLEEEDFFPGKRKKYFQIIRKSGEYLLSIINDILEISHIESRQIKLNISEFSLGDLLNDIFNTCKVLLSEKETVEFKIENIPESVPNNIKGDAVKLRQIMINLINNAIKFTEQGEISFGCYCPKEGVISFFVKDTGSGISPEHQQVIFERFRQIDTPVSGVRRGSGLGLSITKAYVELMEGTIDVQSEQGKGSTFTITFPFSGTGQTSEFSSEKDTVSAPVLSNKQQFVLVAEDEDVSWIFLKQILSRNNFRVIRAKNGKEACELCGESDIDVVLMDINMPEMNGYEALEKIRVMKPGLPVIAQTAYALSDDLKQLKDAFDDYITKPIDRRLLIEKIAAVAGYG
jgi:signal transduction histidine kinase